MEWMQGFRTCALVASVCVTVGCTAYTGKGAEGLPNSQTVGIHAINKSLTIATVDGQDTLYVIYTQRTDYRLTAGFHRLGVKKWTGTTATPTTYRDVTLVAGREYGMKDIPSGLGLWNFEIVDMETGQRIDRAVRP